MIRQCMMLIALILLLMPAAGAFADSTGGVFCGDLAEADCQILLDNDAAMDEVRSVGFTARFAFDMGGDGIDALFHMSGAGSGRLAFDPAAAAALEEPEAYADLEGAAALMEAFFASTAAELTFDVSGATTEEDFALQLNMIMQDGVILLDGASLEALMGESMGELEWLGFDTEGIFDDIFADAGVNADSLATLTAMEEAEAEFTTIERLADDVVNGVPVAVFQSSVDLNAILSGMTVEDLIAEARPNQLGDVDTAFALMQGLDVKKFSTRQYIGIDDLYTHWVDMSMDVALSGEALGMESLDMWITMSFGMNLADFNETFDVSIPEDAFVLPLAMLAQMGSQ